MKKIIYEYEKNNIGNEYASTTNKELQADYHAEAELIRTLERARNSQNLQPLGIAYPNDTVSVVDTIKRNADHIVNASHQFEIPKAMIASILYREGICYNIGDIVFDKRLEDSSRGIGQIKPSTARAAEQAYAAEHPNEISVNIIDTIKSSLNEESLNIYYVSLVLWDCAKQLNITIDLNYDYSSSASVLARYNGTGENAQEYGNETHEYLDAFVRYYREVY